MGIINRLFNGAYAGLGIFLVGAILNDCSQKVQGSQPKYDSRILANQPRAIEQKVDYPERTIENNSPSFSDIFGTDERGREEQIRAQPDLIIQKSQSPIESLVQEIASSIDNISVSMDYQREQADQAKKIEQEQLAYQTDKKESRKLGKDFLTDEFFRNSNYLDSSEIQRLLIEKNSCLKDSGVDKIIVDAAKEYNVNPVLLLSRLQVEKNLVSKQKARDSDIQYGMGYGCFDNGRKLKSSGIEAQVKNAARILNEHYEDFREGKAMRIDYGGRTIVPECAAVYALLKYTPHTSGYHLNKNVIKGLVLDIEN